MKLVKVYDYLVQFIKVEDDEHGINNSKVSMYRSGHTEWSITLY